MGSSSGMTAAGAEKHLREVFGYSAFRPGQLDVISAALAGEVPGAAFWIGPPRRLLRSWLIQACTPET